MRYRVSSRGLLERDGKILFAEYSSSKGSIFTLPGGGQEMGQDLKETLKREFREETSLDVIPGEVILVREFILDTSEFVLWKNGIHQVEIIFRCTQTEPGANAHAGNFADRGMKGIRWLSIDDLNNHIVYPTRDLKSILKKKTITYILEKNGIVISRG